jgi:hypothetical protein
VTVEISLPSEFARYAEMVWGGKTIQWQCVATGCGSSEYEFPDWSATLDALAALQEDLAHILSECFVKDDDT